MRRNAKNRAQKDQSRLTTRRFPRLLEGSHAAAVEKLAWAKPTFRAHVAPQERAIDFVFRMSSAKLPKRYRAVDKILFGLGTNSWEQAFHSAYSHSRYGGKKIDHFLANALRQIFRDGFRRWLLETWSELIPQIAADAPTRQTESDIFGQLSLVKKKQPNPQIALRIALTWNRYVPAIAELKRRHRDRPLSVSNNQLRDEIERILSFDEFMAAFEAILGDPGNLQPRDFLSTRRIRAPQIVKAILERRLNESGYNTREITFQKYLQAGKRIISDLSDSPAPLR